MITKLGNYHITEQISNGSEFNVYKALNTRNESIILKVLENYPHKSEKVKAIEREYQLLSEIHSAFVVRPIELFTHENNYVLALEDIGGITLKNYLIENTPVTNEQHLKRTLEIARQIVLALSDIHKLNINHFDVNTNNIIYNPAHQLIQLIDFSIAYRSIDNEQAEIEARHVSGTYAYIAPEQTGRLDRKPDHRSDFYSFGITLYELLSGRLPFQANNVREWIHAHMAKEPLLLSNIHPEIPKIVSDVVQKLLEKDPSARYQSDYGLLKDLEICIHAINQRSYPKNFKVGKYDIARDFQIPNKLYGRETELKLITRAIEQPDQFESSAILIHGKSGIGKTALIEHATKTMHDNQSLFASGKFEQYEDEKPLQAIGQIIQGLTGNLIWKEADDLNHWKQKIIDTIGNDVGLLYELAPELQTLTGKPENIASIKLTDAQQRLFVTIEKFAGLFMDNNKPLVLFLDDLQWADTTSFNIFLHLITKFKSRPFLFMGAFREEEAQNNQSLQTFIKSLEQKPQNTKSIALHPLSTMDVKELLVDTLNTSIALNDLTEVCFNRTMGNPYFLVEYLYNLHSQGQITFDFKNGRWTWDIELIKSEPVTSNIADLISKKIQSLETTVLQALKTASCFRSSFNDDLLVELSGLKKSQVKHAIEKANQHSLIIATEEKPLLNFIESEELIYYRFIHDKVQASVYELMNKKEKAFIHRNIALLLKEQMEENPQQDHLYALANHLFQATEVLDDNELMLAIEKNLEAVNKAKISGALIQAYRFCNIGFKLLTGSKFYPKKKKLVFEYHTNLARLASLNGNHEEMEELLGKAKTFTEDVLEEIQIHEIRTESLIARNHQQEAVRETLVLLGKLNITFPEKPGGLTVLWKLLKTKRLVNKFSNEKIASLPAMDNTVQLAAMRNMSNVISVLFRTNPNLFSLVVFKLISITLKHGVAPISPVSFITFGLLTNVIFKNVNRAYELGQLGMKLFDHIDGRQHFAQAYYIYNVGISPWKEPLKSTNNQLQEAYKIAKDTGDYEYMMSAAAAGAHYAFRAGHELKNLIVRTEKQKNSISAVYEKISASQFDVLIQMFTNFTVKKPEPEKLIGDIYNEDEMIAYHEQDKDDTSLFMIYLDKLTLAYYFGRYQQAHTILKKANRYIKGVAGLLMFANIKYLESLTLLAIYKSSKQKDQKRLRKKIIANQKQLSNWARHAPMNFKHQYKLVEAEKESIYGDLALASSQYEESITLAQQNGFIHEEALANELCAKHWISNGNDRVAKIYLQRAYQLYVDWGASGKADALEVTYPAILNQNIPEQIPNAKTSSSSSTHIGLSVDIHTIIDAAKTISSEIIPEDLIRKTLTIILEHAGAQKGVLILNENETYNWKVEAIGYVEKDTTKIAISHYDLSDRIVPVAIVNTVIRTNQIIDLPNACESGNFVANPYIQKYKIKSLIALPIVKQANTVGILYLENNLSTHLFTEERVNVLSILCTQLAISLENARLYSTLEQKVKLRTREVIKQKEEIQQQASLLETYNEELKTLNNTKDRLFSIIGHDLRNPFNIILGQAGLLNDSLDEMDPATIKRSVAFIENASKNAFQLLQNLLDWSRSQTGQISFYPQKLNLFHAILYDIATHEAMAETKKISLINQIPKSLEVFADHDMINTIIRNLLSNALKFTHEGGTVALGAEEKDNFVEIYVQDNGIGIAQEDIPKIFSSNETHTKRGTASEKGVGLGLKLCKDFAVQNGGKIKVESESEKGSKFTFTVPKYH